MIIVDRGYDPVAPIIHELTYQAMVNDLLEMDGDVIRYTTTNDQGQEQLKEVILGKTKRFFGYFKIKIKSFKITSKSSKFSIFSCIFVKFV